jgi:uncharacterized protein
MLIEFKVGNFCSFKDIVTLSMVASSDKEHIETNTVKISDKLRLLRSAVIYGANASGKTNLFKAMSFMKYFVLYSSKESQAEEPIEVEKFRLSTVSEKEPSTFEIIFLIDNIRYRYGFQVDEKRVHNEWLYYIPSTREATLFTREKDIIKLGNDFKEGKGLETITRENALFLSVTAQFNGETAKKILQWFKNFNIISVPDRGGYEGFSISKLDDKEFKEFSLQFLKIADLGIKEIQKESTPVSIDNFPKEIPKKLVKNLPSVLGEREIARIITIHQKYDKNNTPLNDESFSLLKNESTGTRTLFGLSAPIYDTLKNERVLVIDEWTSTLHPLLTRAIIEAFHNYKLFKEPDRQSKAQLILSSHDTSILTNQFFRRDQVWFTQKNEFGATDLYSLKEYSIRNDASFIKDYIMGKYGAVPFTGNIESLFSSL